MKIVFLVTAFLFAKSVDPNNYFQDRKWDLGAVGNGYVKAESKYVGEPIAKPSKLSITLHCGKRKKPIVQDLGFCGINSIKAVGGKIEVMFVDYDSSDPKGYCRLRRTESFPVPSC